MRYFPNPSDGPSIEARTGRIWLLACCALMAGCFVFVLLLPISPNHPGLTNPTAAERELMERAGLLGSLAGISHFVILVGSMIVVGAIRDAPDARLQLRKWLRWTSGAIVAHLFVTWPLLFLTACVVR